MSATGDLKNNLLKLQADLKKVNYKAELDTYGLSKGTPASHLPIIHHILLTYSPLLASHFAANHPSLHGKKDARFMEVVYRLLRDEFNYRPRLTREQFFTVGFAEMKLIFLADLIRMCCVLESNLRRAKGESGETRKPKSDNSTRPRTGSSKSSSYRNTSTKSKSKPPTRSNPTIIPRFLPSKVAPVPTITPPETELLRKRVKALKSPYTSPIRPKSAQSTQSHRSPSPSQLYRNSTHHEPIDDPLDILESRYTSPTRPESPHYTTLFSSPPRNPNDSTLHEPSRFPPPKPVEKDSFLATADGRLSMETTFNSGRDNSWRSGVRSPVKSG
ncbi:Centrosomal protein of 44 kDa, partial [Rhizophlyctis rosea]